MKVNHVVVVQNNKGNVGIYINGDLVETVYCSDISTISVTMPDSIKEFPKLFDQCMLWSPKKYES